MPSPKPAVIVRREFEATPAVVTQQLRACIIGQAYQLVRYNNSDEKAKGFIETVSSLLNESYASEAAAKGANANRQFYAAEKFHKFPSLTEESVLDPKSVKVFVEDALVTYADVVDSDEVTSDFRPAANDNSHRELVLTSKAWRGGSRLSGLNQDVQVGDTVQLYTVSGSTTTLIKTTKVYGFESDIVNGSIGALVLDPFKLNYNTAGPANVETGNVRFTMNYTQAFNDLAKLEADPRRQGFNFATYTITIQSADVKAGTILVKITSNRGDVMTTGKADEVTLNLGDANSKAIMKSGLTIVAEIVNSNAEVTVKASTTFDYGPAHVRYNYSNNAAGPGLISAAITDASVLNALPGPTTITVRCTSGGSVKTDNKVTFTWSDSATFTKGGSFNIDSLDTGENQEVLLEGIGVTLTIGAVTAATASNFSLGFVKDDRIQIPVSQATSSLVRKLIVADPYVSTSPVTRVRLSKVKTVEIPRFKPSGSVNWTVDNANNQELRGLTLQSALALRDAAINPNPNVTLYVTAGKLHVQYSSVLALPRAIGSVTTLSDITSQLGSIDPANTLAYAVYKAWTNANGAIVHYIPTISDSLNGYRGFADAFDMAKGVRNCYSIVPLSNSPEVWNACVAHVMDESAPEAGRFRIMWIAPEIDKHFKVQDSPVGEGAVALLGTSSPVAGNPGRWEVMAADTQDSRFTETVRVNDFVRTKFSNDINGDVVFSEFRIIAIRDNKTLVIASAVDPGISNEKIEIFRDLTSGELAAKYVQVAGGFSSERVFAVVPNKGVSGLRVDGKPVRNWNVAAAFAGLRSGSRPHQPLSNVELLGFDGSNATIPAFDEPDLDTLRDGGIWVVVNDLDGRIYAERQLSTSILDNFRKEQSVTCNIDSISFAVGDALKNLVGRVNITNDNIGNVEVTLDTIFGSFSNALNSPSIGPQLLNYAIEEIFVPTTANDTIKAKISVSVPLPMNVIDVTIVV